jgi:hypothetical protein
MTAVVTVPAIAADVGVSVQVGEPGFYGRIDIGNFPQPQLIYLQPVVIEPVPVGVVPQPLYLHVPPGHAKNWRNAASITPWPAGLLRQDRWYDQGTCPLS